MNICYKFISEDTTTCEHLAGQMKLQLAVSYPQREELRHLDSHRPGDAILSAATSADLDRRRFTGGLFWSTNLTPWRVRLFQPPLLCIPEPSMFRPLRETGGGVDDLHCCATHSRGVLKPGNS